MPVEMMACPHCGAGNSLKRRLCFSCQQELHGEPAPAVKRRTLTPRATVPQRQLAETPAETPTTPPSTTRAPATPSRAKARSEPDITPPAAASPLIGATLGQRAQMYRQFYSLQKSGIPLVLSLSYLEKNC